ncbi:hypothetical protein CEXT_704071 [Caerostris extrusa]|uniref:Uncharacterized protein n=1 Tax=Caerostris extrusa TaxID=172846 RepID=A0AAV4TIB4_CAEEX|nr:hypothetical protein CEXT_704071 [Caerostris extrusa]
MQAKFDNIVNSSNSVPCGEEILLSWQIGCHVIDEELSLWAISLEALYNLGFHPPCWHTSGEHPQLFLYVRPIINNRPATFYKGLPPTLLQMPVMSCATENILRDRTMAARLHSRITKASANTSANTLNYVGRKKEGGSSIHWMPQALFPRARRLRRRDVTGLLQWPGRIVAGSGLDQRGDVPSFCACLYPNTIVYQFFITSANI